MLHYRMTHHVLSERRVKDPLRRPSSYSEHPLAIPRNGKFCGPPVCFLKNKKDGVACRLSRRNTATPVACSITGRKSWNKALLPKHIACRQ